VSPTEAAAAESYRSVGDMLRLTRAVHREALDVFFFPSAYTYFPLAPGTRAVITVMDAIPERFPLLTLPSPRARLFWKLKMRLAIAQARLVLTISEYAAREVADAHGVAPGRIKVATPAPADIYRAPATADAIVTATRSVGVPAGARYFAYVGGFNPHKHVDVLIQAHGRFPSDANVHLVLIGATEGDVFHGHGAGIREAIARAGSASRVHWTGYLPDAAVRDLLAGAEAVILPSASEGFGLPPVEGAAQGTPAIATTASPLPELLRGGGVFVAPGSVDALEEAMRFLLADATRRRELGAVARERALALTWERAADDTLAALAEAAA
jgi:alpha-1,3-rhamnosyl/mannosyltransferase